MRFLKILLKAFFLLVPIFLIGTLSAEAAMTRVQSSKGVNTGFASTVSATFGSALTNNSIILTCWEGDTVAANGQSTPTDTAGNTFKKLATANVAATFESEIWYAVNTHTTASDVVTIGDSGGGVDSIMTMEEWTGENTTSPIDATSTGSSATASTTLKTAAQTTTNANDLLFVCGAGANGSNKLSLAGAFSNIVQSSTAFSDLADSTQVTSTVGSVIGQFSQSTAASWAIELASIRAATSSAGAAPIPMRFTWINDD